MFRDKLKFLKEKNDDENRKAKHNQPTDKKKIENLVFFIIVSVITIIFINTIWNDNEKSDSKQENTNSSKQLATALNEDVTKTSSTSEDLEEKLENILSKIQGVGKVTVFVNYSESSETIAMYNETSKTSQTEETDTSGGKRVIEETDTQKDIVYKEEDGEKIPITQKIVQPKIEGAIITAEGAGNAETKTNIIQAVEAATGLATHKIQVFEMQ